MPGEFARLLARLAEAQVRSIVVGGVAVCLHGHVRATADLDLLVEASEENVRRLLDVLAGWGEGWARELAAEDFSPVEAGAVRIEEAEFVLDLFTSMRLREAGSGYLDYARALTDARVCTLENGAKVVYLSAERLIECKTGTNWPKDIQALREILRGGRETSEIKLEALRPATDPGGASDQGEWPLSDPLPG